MRASLEGSPEFGSLGHGMVWRRSREDDGGRRSQGTECRQRFPEREGVRREHIRPNHWQPQPLRLPRKQRADDVRQHEADSRRIGGGDTGEEARKNVGGHYEKRSGERSEDGFGIGSAFRDGYHASSTGAESDERAVYAAVQHLERLHAEIQHIEALKSMLRAGETMPDKGTSQCVYYSPRDTRYKRTALSGLPLPPETNAAQHQAMAERVRLLLTPTDFELSALSIVSDATSVSVPGARRQWEPRASAAVIQTPEPGRAKDIVPRPRAHRRQVPPPTAARQGPQVRHHAPSSEPRQRQERQQPQQQEEQQQSYRAPPRPYAPSSWPASDAETKNIPTKTAFSKRANKKAGWKVTLPPGHSTRPPGLFNPADQMLERQRRARLAHALQARHHTGDTPPMRGEWYRRELARVEVAREQATADRAAGPPRGGGDEGGKNAGARRDRHRRRRRDRIQEAGRRPAETRTAAAAVRDDEATATRELCAGCHQSKRHAKKLIRKYGFCFRCLRKHLVKMDELRSCVECRCLRVKEDYFRDATSGAKQGEVRVCAFCRWRKKGKCEFLCGRVD